MRSRSAGLTLALALLPSRAYAAGAVAAVAQEATRSIGKTLGASVVVAAPLVSDQAVVKGEDLALRIAAIVAGQIGAGARAHPQTAQLATARALAGRASALVYVQGEIAEGDLRATVDVYPSMANAWDRIRNPLPPPASHAFANAKIDAEVRSFLTPLLLEQASIHRARCDEADVLAVACGDVDGDGGAELVLVSRNRIVLGRLRSGTFVAERTAAWSALAPRLPVPMREPLAGAVALPGRIAVGSTERGGLSLAPDLAPSGALLGVPAWGGDGVVCLRSEPSAGAFDGAPVDCAVNRDAKPKLAVPAPRFDTFAAANVGDAAGNARLVIAVREPSGKIRLKVGDASYVPEGTFGAQLAVGDLDEDGAPEIVTTIDGPDDAINVLTWAPATADLRPRLHIPAPGGVRALAMCPPEKHGEPALVAVVGSEVWLVRAGWQDGKAVPR